jgi:hypothetical protein
MDHGPECDGEVAEKPEDGDADEAGEGGGVAENGEEQERAEDFVAARFPNEAQRGDIKGEQRQKPQDDTGDGAGGFASGGKPGVIFVGDHREDGQRAQEKGLNWGEGGGVVTDATDALAVAARAGEDAQEGAIHPHGEGEAEIDGGDQWEDDPRGVGEGVHGEGNAVEEGFVVLRARGAGEQVGLPVLAAEKEGDHEECGGEDGGDDQGEAMEAAGFFFADPRVGKEGAGVPEDEPEGLEEGSGTAAVAAVDPGDAGGDRGAGNDAALGTAAPFGGEGCGAEVVAAGGAGEGGGEGGGHEGSVTRGAGLW